MTMAYLGEAHFDANDHAHASRCWEEALVALDHQVGPRVDRLRAVVLAHLSEA